MSRTPIPKKIRLLVYEKCNGHCAYCGCELEYKDMQIDHIESLAKHDYDLFFKGIERLTERELHSIENYMPSCRACNFYKSTFDLETFRQNISTKLYNNMSTNFNYKLLLKYGLIKEDIKPVQFYFEKVKDGGENEGSI